jgi:hypothetical protein
MRGGTNCGADAGTLETCTLEAGALDTGAPDAGTLDAGKLEAGSEEAAGADVTKVAKSRTQRQEETRIMWEDLQN